jgi:catechol 2,3-dioxygenase-like lactoylglutathione lyase family enzyme
MTVDLFAGIPVSDLPRSLAWYERLLGSEPSFLPNDVETRIAAGAARGVEPAERETYANGVRHATYRDPDGNEFCLGGPPELTPDHALDQTR